MQRQTPLSLPIIRSRREQHAHVSHTASCIKVRQLASKRKKKRATRTTTVCSCFILDWWTFFLFVGWMDLSSFGQISKRLFFFFSPKSLRWFLPAKKLLHIALFSATKEEKKKKRKRTQSPWGVALQTWTKCAQERTCSEQARLMQTNAHKWQVREGNQSRKISQSTMIHSPKKATQSHTQTVSGTNVRKLFLCRQPLITWSACYIFANKWRWEHGAVTTTSWLAGFFKFLWYLRCNVRFFGLAASHRTRLESLIPATPSNVRFAPQTHKPLMFCNQCFSVVEWKWLL